MTTTSLKLHLSSTQYNLTEWNKEDDPTMEKLLKKIVLQWKYNRYIEDGNTVEWNWDYSSTVSLLKLKAQTDNDKIWKKIQETYKWESDSLWIGNEYSVGQQHSRWVGLWCTVTVKIWHGIKTNEPDTRTTNQMIMTPILECVTEQEVRDLFDFERFRTSLSLVGGEDLLPYQQSGWNKKEVDNFIEWLGEITLFDVWTGSNRHLEDATELQKQVFKKLIVIDTKKKAEPLLFKIRSNQHIQAEAVLDDFFESLDPLLQQLDSFKRKLPEFEEDDETPDDYMTGVQKWYGDVFPEMAGFWAIRERKKTTMEESLDTCVDNIEKMFGALLGKVPADMNTVFKWPLFQERWTEAFVSYPELFNVFDDLTLIYNEKNTFERMDTIAARMLSVVTRPKLIVYAAELQDRVLLQPMNQMDDNEFKSDVIKFTKAFTTLLQLKTVKGTGDLDTVKNSLTRAIRDNTKRSVEKYKEETQKVNDEYKGSDEYRAYFEATVLLLEKISANPLDFFTAPIIASGCLNELNIIDQATAIGQIEAVHAKLKNDSFVLGSVGDLFGTYLEKLLAFHDFLASIKQSRREKIIKDVIITEYGKKVIESAKNRLGQKCNEVFKQWDTLMSTQEGSALQMFYIGPKDVYVNGVWTGVPATVEEMRETYENIKGIDTMDDFYTFFTKNEQHWTTKAEKIMPATKVIEVIENMNRIYPLLETFKEIGLGGLSLFPSPVKFYMDQLRLDLQFHICKPDWEKAIIILQDVSRGFVNVDELSSFPALRQKWVEGRGKFNESINKIISTYPEAQYRHEKVYKMYPRHRFDSIDDSISEELESGDDGNEFETLTLAGEHFVEWQQYQVCFLEWKALKQKTEEPRSVFVSVDARQTDQDAEKVWDDVIKVLEDRVTDMNKDYTLSSELLRVVQSWVSTHNLEARTEREQNNKKRKTLKAYNDERDKYLNQAEPFIKKFHEMGGLLQWKYGEPYYNLKSDDPKKNDPEVFPNLCDILFPESLISSYKEAVETNGKSTVSGPIDWLKPIKNCMESMFKFDNLNRFPNTPDNRYMLVNSCGAKWEELYLSELRQFPDMFGIFTGGTNSTQWSRDFVEKQAKMKDRLLKCLKETEQNVLELFGFVEKSLKAIGELGTEDSVPILNEMKVLDKKHSNVCRKACQDDITRVKDAIATHYQLRIWVASALQVKAWPMYERVMDIAAGSDRKPEWNGFALQMKTSYSNLHRKWETAYIPLKDPYVSVSELEMIKWKDPITDIPPTEDLIKMGFDNTHVKFWPKIAVAKRDMKLVREKMDKVIQDIRKNIEKVELPTATSDYIDYFKAKKSPWTTTKTAMSENGKNDNIDKQVGILLGKSLDKVTGIIQPFMNVYKVFAELKPKNDNLVIIAKITDFCTAYTDLMNSSKVYQPEWYDVLDSTGFQMFVNAIVQKVVHSVILKIAKTSDSDGVGVVFVTKYLGAYGAYTKIKEMLPLGVGTYEWGLGEEFQKEIKKRSKTIENKETPHKTYWSKNAAKAREFLDKGDYFKKMIEFIPIIKECYSGDTDNIDTMTKLLIADIPQNSLSTWNLDTEYLKKVTPIVKKKWKDQLKNYGIVHAKYLSLETKEDVASYKTIEVDPMFESAVTDITEDGSSYELEDVVKDMTVLCNLPIFTELNDVVKHWTVDDTLTLTSTNTSISTLVSALEKFMVFTERKRRLCICANYEFFITLFEDGVKEMKKVLTDNEINMSDISQVFYRASSYRPKKTSNESYIDMKLNEGATDVYMTDIAKKDRVVYGNPSNTEKNRRWFFGKTDTKCLSVLHYLFSDKDERPTDGQWKGYGNGIDVWMVGKQANQDRTPRYLGTKDGETKVNAVTFPMGNSYFKAHSAVRICPEISNFYRSNGQLSNVLMILLSPPGLAEIGKNGPQKTFYDWISK